MRSSLLWIFAVTACLVGSGIAPTAARAQGAPMNISSPQFSNAGATAPFANGSAIPAKYACAVPGNTPDGGGISPPLTFSNVPNTAKSLVLIVVDVDAPNGYNAAGNYPEGFLHWLLYNIDPTTSSIQEGGAPPSPAIVGENGYGSSDYRGPCPPPATGLHRYFFRLYALDGPIAPATPTEMDVERAMTGRRTVATATLVGTFGTLLPSQQPSNPAQPTQPISNPLAPPVVQIVPSTTSAQVGQVVGFAYSVGATAAPIQIVDISFGDGAIEAGNVAGGTVTHAYSAPGNYAAIISAIDSDGEVIEDETYVFVAGAISTPPPTTVNIATGQAPVVQITSSAQAAQVGQQVTFTYTVTAGSAPIQSVLVSTGDGVVAPGPIPSFAFPYEYSAPGTYQVTVTATDVSGRAGQATTTISIAQAGQATTTVSNRQPAVPTIGITYPAGWNLIAAPTGTVITGASLPLYTWQNGDVSYASSNTTQPGFGYWAYFPAQSTTVLTITAPTTITKALQPNVYIMIGNAGSTPATVSGADVVYVYNPTSGYQTTNVLQPGQGAWVLSLRGGNVTLTNGQP